MRVTGRSVAIVLAVLAFGGVLAGLAAADVVSTTDVKLDDPDNQTAAVDVEFSADNSEAVVELVDANGDVQASETLTGNSSDTATASFDASGLAQGGYSIDVSNGTNTATGDLTVLETRHTTATTVNVTAANETVFVDVGFAAAQNATASIEVRDGDGTLVNQTTVDYVAADHEDNQTVITEEFQDENATAGDWSVEVQVTDADAYDSLTIDALEDGGLFGGGLTGTTAGLPNWLLGVLVLAALAYATRGDD